VKATKWLLTDEKVFYTNPLINNKIVTFNCIEKVGSCIRLSASRAYKIALYVTVSVECLLQVQRRKEEERTNVSANYEAYINDLLEDCHYLLGNHYLTFV